MSSKLHHWRHAKNSKNWTILYYGTFEAKSKVLNYIPILYCLDSLSSLVWSRNSVLPSPLVSWSLKTSYFMASIGNEAWLHSEAENSINLIQYCHHIPNWLWTLSSLSLCYFWFLEKIALSIKTCKYGRLCRPIFSTFRYGRKLRAIQNENDLELETIFGNKDNIWRQRHYYVRNDSPLKPPCSDIIIKKLL